MNETAPPDDEILYTIVTRTAERSKTDMFDLEPLASVIDPELVQSFASAENVTAESELRFHYNGCEVCIDGTGEITVQQL